MSSKGLALITGATGYIGSATLAAFVNAGWQTRAIARSQEKADAWTKRNPGLKVEWAIAPDLSTKGAALHAMDGVTHVIHVAADLPGAMEKGVAGVEKTINAVIQMLEAAKATKSVKASRSVSSPR